jgi:hypothetical protein
VPAAIHIEREAGHREGRENAEDDDDDDQFDEREAALGAPFSDAA